MQAIEFGRQNWNRQVLTSQHEAFHRPDCKIFRRHRVFRRQAFRGGGDAEDAIRALADASGLAVDAFSEVVIRHDRRQPVTGGFFHLV
jgi:hypothetical protein